MIWIICYYIIRYECLYITHYILSVNISIKHWNSLIIFRSHCSKYDFDYRKQYRNTQFKLWLVSILSESIFVFKIMRYMNYNYVYVSDMFLNWFQFIMMDNVKFTYCISNRVSIEIILIYRFYVNASREQLYKYF